jgi:hypothetical protein
MVGAASSSQAGHPNARADAHVQRSGFDYHQGWSDDGDELLKFFFGQTSTRL